MSHSIATGIYITQCLIKRSVSSLSEMNTGLNFCAYVDNTRTRTMESSLSARPVDQSKKGTGCEVLLDKVLLKVTNWGIRLQILILIRLFRSH